MLWTVHPGNTADEDCLELARVQMPPSPIFGRVVAGNLFPALRTAELCTNWVFDFHLDFLFCNVQFDIRDGPRGCKSKNMLIEFFVLYYWGFLSPAIVPSPTEMPNGPFSKVNIELGFFQFGS
jgi:hypothetical protein